MYLLGTVVIIILNMKIMKYKVFICSLSQNNEKMSCNPSTVASTKDPGCQAFVSNICSQQRSEKHCKTD